MVKGDRVVGLDIGTTKMCAIVAEVETNGQIKVTGVGNSPSEGLKRGVVVNVEKTVQSIRKAIEEAERMSDSRIAAVYGGIAGDHIQSLNCKGVVAVSGADNEIADHDVERVIEAAKAVSIPAGREIIHVLPQEYAVDDQPGIKDPIGMSGVRLEVDVHIVTGSTTSAQNICKSIRRAGVEVVDLVLEPIASSYAVLSPEEEEMGVVLVDIGGGTTDLALFYDGSIRHTAVIGLGGQNVTHDVAIGLRTTWNQAEEIKRTHGCAMRSLVGKEETIDVPGVAGRHPYKVPRAELAAIVEARMEEIFTLVHREIRKTDYADLLAAGVVITGGGAMLQGCLDLAEEILGMPVSLGVPKGIVGLVDAVNQPIYATAVGLVLFGMDHESRTAGPARTGGDNIFKRIFRRLTKGAGDFF